MATVKPSYGSVTSITCALDAITSSATAARQSTVVDNTSNLYMDALVTLQLQTASGSLGTNPVVYVYAYGWFGSGSNYTDGCTGSDGSFTLPSSLPPNLKLVQVISYNVSANTTMYSSPFSIAAAFAGILPQKWGIVVNNQTGLSLSGSSGNQTNNLSQFIPINYTVA